MPPQSSSLDPREGPLDAESEPLSGPLVRALPRLRAHLARSGGEVDDLTQETAERALRAAPQFDRSRALWPWLRRIADRVRIDSAHRRRRIPEPVAELDPAAPEPMDLEREREAAAALVRALPERQRTVLVRFHIEGESIEEIALTLGVPPGTVKSDLSRARRRLAEWHSDGEETSR